MPFAAKMVIASILFILGVASVYVSPKEKYSELALVGSEFFYNFNEPGTLSEAGNMAESASPYWWLSSGGVMEIADGKGSTNVGELPALSRWRLLYRVSNPSDTDNGYHPQNIFRLVSRNTWQDFSEEAYFKIIRDNLSGSSNRNVSNGVLLMSRYMDSNNLYYAGLRVDGTAVIKKKREGEYTTLAQKKVFEGKYDRRLNPSLLQKGKWFGIRLETKNVGDAVVISFYADLENTGEWQLIVQASDMADHISGLPLYGRGFAGIRTDFMDVEFRNYKVSAL